MNYTSTCNWNAHNISILCRGSIDLKTKVECIINLVCSPVNPAISLKIRYFKKFNPNSFDLIWRKYIYHLTDGKTRKNFLIQVIPFILTTVKSLKFPNYQQKKLRHEFLTGTFSLVFARTIRSAQIICSCCYKFFSHPWVNSLHKRRVRSHYRT